MNVMLWRYPVKSMIGETVDSVEVDALGVVGDRIWTARDLERGGIRGAKNITTPEICEITCQSV